MASCQRCAPTPRCGSVTIPSFVIVDVPSPHIEFVIQYEQARFDGGFMTFRTQHRFSEFLMLHKLLLPSKESLPDLPDAFPSAKRLLHGDAVLQQRRRELEQYLNLLVEACHPAGLHSALCSFLKNSIPPKEHHCHACTHNQSSRGSAAFAFLPAHDSSSSSSLRSTEN